MHQFTSDTSIKHVVCNPGEETKQFNCIEKRKKGKRLHQDGLVSVRVRNM